VLLGLVPALRRVHLPPELMLLVFLPPSCTGRVSPRRCGRSGRTCAVLSSPALFSSS
jgi:hypothetical protein